MDDKRNCIRYPLFLGAKLDASSAVRQENPCIITDISRSGCRIENIPLSLMAARRFSVQAQIPSFDFPVKFKATVQWSSQKQGAGCAGCTIEETRPGDKFDLMDLAYKKWRAGIPRYANPNGL